MQKQLTQQELNEITESVMLKEWFMTKNIHKAAKKGDIKSLVYNIRADKDIDGLDSNGIAPLHYAVHAGQKDAVKTLIKGGADVNLQTAKPHWTPLELAVRGSNFDIAEMLIDSQADPNTGMNVKFLYDAIGAKDAQRVKRLLEFGISANPGTAWDDSHPSFEKYGSPLMLAARLDSTGIVNLLLSADATPDQNALKAAIWNGNREIIERFSDHGVNFDSETLNKSVVSAVADNNVKAVKGFIYAGANPNATTKHDSSLLHLAAFKGHHGVVMELINLGADAGAKDAFGETPFEVAKKSGNRRSAKYLKQYHGTEGAADDSGPNRKKKWGFPY